MFENDNYGRSFYQPNAFYIKLNSDYVEKGGLVADEYLPKFFHEYGHLIQDTTTCYGVIDFIHFIDTIQDTLRLIDLSVDHNVLTIPLFRNSTFNDLWISKLIQFRSCTNPNKDWRKGAIWKFNKFLPKEFRNVPYNQRPNQIPIIKASFVDSNSATEFTQELGVREIKEAYSIAIENIKSGTDFEYSEDMEFQYAAIDRILSAFWGYIDNKRVITICHWALQDTHPIENFHDIVLELWKEYDELPDVEELYDYLRQRFLSRNPQLIKSIQENFNKILENQQKSGVNDLLYCSYAWYKEKIISNLRLIEDSSRRFPLDTNFVASNNDIGELVLDFPIWLYETYDENSFAFSVEKDTPLFVYFFRSLCDLVNHLLMREETEWNCIWNSTCKDERIPFKDSKCASMPWAHSEHRPACPFGAAAAYLKLKKDTLLSIRGN
jgi:hypothetical protein